jgi:hypothetical protein
MDPGVWRSAISPACPWHLSRGAHGAGFGRSVFRCQVRCPSGLKPGSYPKAHETPRSRRVKEGMNFMKDLIGRERGVARKDDRGSARGGRGGVMGSWSACSCRPSRRTARWRAASSAGRTSGRSTGPAAAPANASTTAGSSSRRPADTPAAWTCSGRMDRATSPGIPSPPPSGSRSARGRGAGSSTEGGMILGGIDGPADVHAQPAGRTARPRTSRADVLIPGRRSGPAPARDARRRSRRPAGARKVGGARDGPGVTPPPRPHRPALAPRRRPRC